MRQTFLILVFCAFCFGGVAAATASIADLYNDIPRKNTPRKLQEAWLQFHESGLCQDVDAAFIFDDGGMQIWSRIVSDKSYSKFQALFASPQGPYRIELYTNRPGEEKEPEKADYPPPSLWQNHELRANLGDRAAQSSIFNEEEVIIHPSASDPLLKQRLLIYGEQVMSRNRKMEHYALDLFSLARMASDPGIPHETRSKAMAICSSHAIDLEKSIAKLRSDLVLAIPLSARGDNRPSQRARPHTANKPVVEEAAQIYRDAQSVARRVHRFIYPEYYTVELNELRNPSLIQSIRTLQQTVLEFQKTLRKPGRKPAVRVED